MPKDVSERTYARLIAFERWPKTGFLCLACGCVRGAEVANRDRMWRCRDCRRQQSVLSGTALEHTKLKLKVWWLRAEHFQVGQVPTGRAFAAEAEIARSTAWGLNHKFMLLHEAIHHTSDYGARTVTVLCRRPVPTARLGPNATPHMHSLESTFLRETRDVNRPVTFGVRTLGRRAVLGNTALTQTEADTYCRHESFLNHLHFDQWIQLKLRQHHNVSLRWLSRWVAHYCLVWSIFVNQEGTPMDRAPDWPHRVACSVPASFRTLPPDSDGSIRPPP